MGVGCNGIEISVDQEARHQPADDAKAIHQGAQGHGDGEACRLDLFRPNDNPERVWWACKEPGREADEQMRYELGERRN